MDNVPFDPDATTAADPSAKPYRHHARTAWLLMGIVAAISFIPLVGFASWYLASPILLVAFILTILVFVKGGIGQGLALLLCQLVVMPLVVIFGPIISATLGFAGGAETVASSSSSSSPGSSSGQEPVQLTAELEDLKAKLAEQRPRLTRWLADRLAEETNLGYLRPVADTDLDLEVRRAIQQENIWRASVFEKIGEITGQSPEEVAAIYARLAGGK